MNAQKFRDEVLEKCLERVRLGPSDWEAFRLLFEELGEQQALTVELHRFLDAHRVAPGRLGERVRSVVASLEGVHRSLGTLENPVFVGLLPPALGDRLGKPMG